MIKVFCDGCGKEVERDEKCILMRVICPELTGEGALERHMHEGCAVAFLGADNVAAYGRLLQEKQEAQEKAKQEVCSAFPHQHNADCGAFYPSCLCLRCEKDWLKCCTSTEHGGTCPVKTCPSFEPEKMEDAGIVSTPVQK